jgi:hypothetical protein
MIAFHFMTASLMTALCSSMLQRQVPTSDAVGDAAAAAVNAAAIKLSMRLVQVLRSTGSRIFMHISKSWVDLPNAGCLDRCPQGGARSTAC